MDALTLLGRTGGRAAADLGFLGLLLADTRDIDGFVERTIGRVAAYDRRRGTELVRTLQAYFDSGMSPARTKDLLHVHVNTVAQRLERVAHLLGEDWQSPTAHWRSSSPCVSTRWPRPWGSGVLALNAVRGAANRAADRSPGPSARPPVRPLARPSARPSARLPARRAADCTGSGTLGCGWPRSPTRPASPRGRHGRRPPARPADNPHGGCAATGGPRRRRRW